MTRVHYMIEGIFTKEVEKYNAESCSLAVSTLLRFVLCSKQDPITLAPRAW